jgi:ACS family hexuronate transporter-like MFS transporter
MAVPLAIIYMVAGLGSVGAGWIASVLLRRGHTVNAARKTALLICALCAVPVFLTPHAPVAWEATALLALAAAAHQGWSANFYTIVSDTMPRNTVSSIVGMGGMAGSVAAMGFAELIGHILQGTGLYFIPFIIASSGYLLALLSVQLLVPRIQRIDFGPLPVEVVTPVPEHD